MVLSYILARLERLYLPGEIIPRIMQKFEGRKPYIKNNLLVPRKAGLFGKSVSGILVKCAGRFTRAQDGLSC